MLLMLIVVIAVVVVVITLSLIEKRYKADKPICYRILTADAHQSTVRVIIIPDGAEIQVQTV